VAAHVVFAQWTSITFNVVNEICCFNDWVMGHL
jgi:hypothetical protein